MSPLPFAIWLLLASAHVAVPERMIDWCAQDGTYFYAMNDNAAQLVEVGRDGVTIRIEHSDPKREDVAITFRKGNSVLVQRRKDFEAGLGWLTVSPTVGFATTWKDNASDAESQLFRATADGGIKEDTELIPLAEKTFISDAKRICKEPGVNTTAIKWIDDDHLLLAINAWSSLSCQSNFTEGFILSPSDHAIDRKLTERELIDMPAVCTWNVVRIKNASPIYR